jgi:hypothetical protein
MKRHCDLCKAVKGRVESDVRRAGHYVKLHKEEVRQRLDDIGEFLCALYDNRAHVSAAVEAAAKASNRPRKGARGVLRHARAQAQMP